VIRATPRRPATLLLAGITVGLICALVPIANASSSGAATANGSVSKAPRWTESTTFVPAFNVVSCASAKSCVAVGTSSGTDDAVQLTGNHWSAERKIAQYAGEVVSLSCPTVGWCMALTDLAAATVLSGGRWSNLQTLDPNPGPPYPGMANAVSCPSSRFCVAVDGQGNSETYDGASWTRPKAIDPEGPLNDVSCPTAGRCVAVDGDGRVVELSNGRWSRPRAIDDTALSAVSCASSRFCLAVDLLGRGVTLDGSHWSSPTRIDSSLDVPLAVTCPEVARCVAVDVVGRVLVLNGGHWTTSQAPETNLATTASLVDVSCPAGDVDFCATVDASGDALTTTNVFGSDPK
jgi:uncharacterized Fe-S cluster protein YjdI